MGSSGGAAHRGARRGAFVVVGVTIALSILTAAPASAQSLAEIARREAARRATVDEPAKTYTNDDLEPYPSRITRDDAAAEADDAGTSTGATRAAEDATTAAPDTEGESTAPAEDAEPVRDEAYWRGRIGAVRTQLERNQLFLEALQSRVNALTTQFVNMDDPAQRALVAIDRQKAQAEIERVQTEVQRLNDEIAEIEEEARRASVPPGWLR